MKATTQEEIERVFGNRLGETHPFKGGRAGMESFAQMLPLMDELTEGEVIGFVVPMMDDLLARVWDCHSCKAKGLVFAELLCSGNAREQANEYRRQYEEHCGKNRRSFAQRDYRQEVLDAMVRYGHP